MHVWCNIYFLIQSFCFRLAAIISAFPTVVNCLSHCGHAEEAANPGQCSIWRKDASVVVRLCHGVAVYSSDDIKKTINFRVDAPEEGVNI
jgi:hypothetical protein